MRYVNILSFNLKFEPSMRKEKMKLCKMHALVLICTQRKNSYACMHVVRTINEIQEYFGFVSFSNIKK